TGRRYLLSDRNLWLTDFLEMIGSYAQQPAPTRILPASLIVLGGVIGEIAGRLHPGLGERLCWETAAHAREAQFFNAERTWAELGWQPRRPLEQAAAEAVDYFSGRLAERCLTVSDALVS